MKRLAILGGASGVGSKLLEEASIDYAVKIYGRPEYNMFVSKSMMVLGRILQRTRPDVFILNASGPIIPGKDEYAYIQTDALKTLWPFIKGLDLTLVIMSSAGSWRVDDQVDPVLKLFRKSKYQLSSTALDLCWKKTTDAEHLARTVLFEPSTMNPIIAEKAKIPYLSIKDAWHMIKLGIDSNLPFIRLGCQGNDCH